ncbi:SAM-dependent methyltransferase [Jiangella mangrovi]|uniref:Cyclopropane-fatty-acyl-phospholipid synthase n=1 Tax=Jiangella mangrovi TaxID=1524084 RepID=A0A7W9GMV2_9ACTN|nr:cyclopropane-fatty-acyl-phospholipid synthase family protein [Jiangella mangrovi]MBB5786639.1 cyclopropane-fatty-acyl-phospholipid synthase [Jiangella mangrovi]
MTTLTEIDAGLWPDVARVPAAGAARLRAARTAIAHATRVAGVRLREAGGADAPGDRPPGDRRPVLEVLRPHEFYARLGRDGLIGFGEGYMSGAWTAPDLAGLLTAFAARLTSLVPPPLQKLRRAFQPSMPAAELADRAGARRNVSRHYDLSNELFALFLDPTMTYSSALFEPGDDLERAQLRKIDAVLDAASVRPGSRVLEIGTGWGALAVRAATERGARVTTVTLSEEQARLARSRVEAAGVADLVDIQVRDYRDVEGRYDAVVSVEMIEAVSERHWPDYFAALGRALAPGGRVGLQAITMPHDHLLATRHSWTWIHKYVFPGGLIPSEVAIRAHALRDGGLAVLQRRSFGAHYAETLRQWRERFLAAADAVSALGFDPVFRRMWEFYLAYCEAGFRTGRLDVEQYTLGAGGVR